MNKILIIIVGIIIGIIVIIESLIFLHITRLPFIQLTFLGVTHSLTHWIGWIGTLFIAFHTPMQPLIKRKFPKHMQTTLNIHMIGNLIAVLLVSVHFSQQVTRPASNYPDFGTGIVLYAVMILLVSTGFVMYSDIAKRYYKQLLFFHPAFALTFYIAIIIHILQNVL